MKKMNDYDRIEKAIRFLMENVNDQPTLEDLSRALNLSSFHCHRLFKKWAGITPKDFLQVLTLIKAKELLADSKSLLETSLSLGLSGPSRLHDLFINLEAMTPGEFKKEGAGLQIDWDIFTSPMGRMVIGKTRGRVCSLFFSETDDQRKIVRQMKQRWPQAVLIKNAKALEGEKKIICDRMAGRKDKKIDLLLAGSDFQIKIWQALLSIPEGQTATYRKIAVAIGQPKAVRAVGTAIGANPIGYLIPCHRVIRSSGAVGEYHWGGDRKAIFLAVEGARQSAGLPN